MTPSDICPKCQGTLASPGEACPACGFQPSADPGMPEAQPAKEPTGITGLIEMDYTVANTDGKPELPQWRVELSRRFQEIKNKREGGMSPAGTPEQTENPGESTAPNEGAAQPKDTAGQNAPAAVPLRPRRPRAARPASRPEITVSRPSASSPMPLFAPTPAPEPQPETAAHGTIQEMIDRAVAERAAAAAPNLPASGPVLPKPESLPLESRLILLSRTLAGLVDIIIIVFCAAAFVIAADRFSGIETLDGRSLAHFTALLLATYFLYSIFFLFTGNQTIGMMITDLCVVDVEKTRPRMAHIVRRCVLYLVSILGAGIGLLWGCFDKEARCLHDRYSGTRVVRIAR